MSSMNSMMKGLVDYDASSGEEDDTDESTDDIVMVYGNDEQQQDRQQGWQGDKTGSSADHCPMEVAPRSVPQPGLSKCDPPDNKKSKMDGEACQKLQLPGTIQSMFESQERSWVDDPNAHDQRVRSFPHVEGNWATHVFIPVPWDNRLFEFINTCVRLLSPLPFHAMPELHMSLSRTVTIRHHWIESLVDSLRTNLSHLKGCLSDFSGVMLVTNDEKTRTFVCFELTTDDTFFLDYVAAVDKSLAEFKLQEYYENPSFHVSVGWCLGDVAAQVSEEQNTRLKAMFSDFMASNPDLSVLNVQEVCCRTGNKSFVIPLKSDVPR